MAFNHVLVLTLNQISDNTKNHFFPIAEGGAKNVGVFRVKNHDYTPKNHIFSNFRGGARRVRPDVN
jgi:hypothetical protein